MSIGLFSSCDPTLGRVTITASGIGHACCALVERSTDQTNWVTVRGASCWPVSGVTGVSGVGWVFPCNLYDYEYDTCVPNYYRLSTSCPSESISFVAAGAPGLAANGPVSPGLPAGTSAAYRDLVVILAASRAPAATVDTPAGWTPVSPGPRRARMYARVYDGTWEMPTVTFTGDVVNETTIAQAATFRNAGLPLVSSAVQDNVSAQDILAPGAFDPGGHHVAVRAGAKSDDWTSVAEPAGYTEIGEPDSTSGNDAGITWAYRVETTNPSGTQPSATFVVTGGAAAVSVGLAVILGRATVLETATIGPVSCSNGNLFWLKDPTRPSLNVGIDLSCPPASGLALLWPSNPAVRRRARAGIFPVVGRTYPVAATDLRLAREWQLDLRSSTSSAFTRLDTLLATGDVLFIQPPCDCLLQYPGGYVAPLDLSYEPHVAIANQVDWSIPVVEVAAPGPDVGEGCPVVAPVA